MRSMLAVSILVKQLMIFFFFIKTKVAATAGDAFPYDPIIKCYWPFFIKLLN